MTKSKKTAILIGLIILISVMLILSLLAQKASPTVRFPATQDPAAYYSLAREAVSDCQNMQSGIHTFQIIKTKENIFTTNTHRNIIYLNKDTNDLQISATETTHMGRHTIETSTVFFDNTLYYTLNGSKFTGSSTPEAISQQCLSPALLDPTAYQSIVGLQVGDSTVIRFSSPTQPENWCGIDAASFLDAQGSAWIDKHGDLVKSTYNLCYTEGDYTFYRSVTVQITDLDPSPVTVPTNTSDFVNLADPLLPLQLELACGYLLQTQIIASSHTDTITCELFGDTRVQNIDISAAHGTGNPALEMSTQVSISNNSREGEVFTSKQVQRYDNGSYTAVTDDNPAVTTQGVSPQELHTICQEVLIGTILLPQHIQSANVVYAEDTHRIEFAANDKFAQKIISDACTTLYDDPQLMDQLSSEHRIDKNICYLEIDAISGLPVKTGIHFLGTYYTSDLPYQLIFESDQAYRIP